MTSNDQNLTDWQRTPERGTLFLYRLMSWISLHLGRTIGRIILYFIVAYFFLFASDSRVGSRVYLNRILPKPARWLDIYKHFFCFASTIHDRIYFINNRFNWFKIDVYGKDLILEALSTKTGLFLIGGHVGSFEAIRALGREHLDLKIVMAMYEENARKLMRSLNAINPAAQENIISLGRIDSILKLNQYLDDGALVGMLADRTLKDGATRPIKLLGSEANLPTGPFRIVAALGRPALFMVGLYTGKNQYEIHFEKLADFSKLEPKQKQQAIEQAMVRYAELLEKYCRRSPYNWFNFFDVWKTSSSSHIKLI